MHAFFMESSWLKMDFKLLKTHANCNRLQALFAKTA